MEISSAPYLIDSVTFGLADSKKNLKKLEELKQLPSKSVGSFKRYPLIEYIKSPTESFIVLELDGEIAYLVHLKAEKLKQFPVPSVTQIAVWRSLLKGTVTSGLPKFVFEKILLRRYQYIVSDTAQSDRGKDFWILRLGDAVNSGHEVGVFDVDEPADKIIWVSTQREFEDWMKVHQAHAWGKVFNHHEQIRFVIKR